MPSLYKIFGYTGALPFWACAAYLISTEDSGMAIIMTIAQMGYGAMILSFLGGVFWFQGLRDQSKLLLSLAMLPTILSAIVTLVFIFLVSGAPKAPVFFFWISLTFYFLLPILFIAQLLLEYRWLDRSLVPQGYLCFRKNITIIVCLSFFVVPFFV